MAASIGLARFTLTLVIPGMRRGLDLSYTDFGTIATAGFATYTLTSPFAGAVCTRLGLRRTIAASLVVSAAGLAGLAVATGYWSAIVANVVAQLGTAGANAGGFAMATAWFPPSRRGAATGVVMGGAGVGIAGAGAFVPRILAAGPEGWRGAWAAAAGLVALIALACGMGLRGEPAEGHVAARETGEDRVSVLREKGLWAVAVLVALFGFEYIVFGTFFAAHLTSVGWATATIGRLWAVVGFATIVSGVVGGALSDRIGRLPALAALFSAQAAASVLLARGSSHVGVLVAVLLYGLTVMGFPAIVGAACGDIAGAARAAGAVGFVNLFFGIGQMLGPIAAGRVIDATGSVGVALLTAAGTAAVGGAGAMLIGLTARRRARARTGQSFGGVA